VVVLVLHEHHVSDFKSVNEVLNAGSEVTSSSPDILDKGDFCGIDFKFFSEPAVVELDALVLEEDEFTGFVENLNADHDETGVVSSSESDVVEIVESEAKLRADEGVGGWIHLSSDAVGLEAEDTCRHVINIVAPTGNNGVAVDFLAGDASGGEGALEGVPGLTVGDLFLETDPAALPDEGVLAAAAGWGGRYLESPQVVTASDLRQK
jgi:hypothetical protein